MPGTSNIKTSYFAGYILFPRDKQVLICMKIGLTGKRNLYLCTQTPVINNFDLAD